MKSVKDVKFDLEKLSKLDKDLVVRTLISQKDWKDIEKLKHLLMIEKVSELEDSEVVVDITLARVEKKRCIVNLVGLSILFSEL